MAVVSESVSMRKHGLRKEPEADGQSKFKRSILPEIKVIDTTLRDAHQSLWATRMTTAMMLPVAEEMDCAGFEAIDLMSAVQFDVCVRFLKEDPWERLRLMRERVTRTKLQSAMRSKSLMSFDVQPDDINFLWLECLAKNGIRRVRAIDALGDLGQLSEDFRGRRVGWSRSALSSNFEVLAGKRRGPVLEVECGRVQLLQECLRGTG